MESLMAALVAGVLIRATDPSSAFVSRTAGRTGKNGTVAVGAFIALSITQTLAALIGSLLVPHMTPDAARLLLGVALVAAGATVFLPAKETKQPSAQRPLLGTAVFLTATGAVDRTQFSTLALAAGGIPALAGIGGTIGSLVVLGVAAGMSEHAWRALPHRAIRASGGVILVATGSWLALSGLGLV